MLVPSPPATVSMLRCITTRFSFRILKFFEDAFFFLFALEYHYSFICWMGGFYSSTTYRVTPWADGPIYLDP
jgi:hypothetical protein